MVAKRTVVIVAPLLVVVLGLLLPLWFGHVTEDALRRLAERGAGGGVAVTVDRFERGWLSSTAATRISVPGLPLEFVARHRISHGPLPIDRIVGGALHIRPVQARFTSEMTIAAKGPGSTQVMPVPLTAETEIDLAGGGAVQLHLPAQRVTGRDGATVEWRGLSASLEFDRDFTRLAVELQSPGVAYRDTRLRGPYGQWGVSDVMLRVQAEQGLGGHYFGTTHIRAGRVELGSDLVFRGLELRAAAAPEATDVNFTVTGHLRQVEVARERYGPASMVIATRRLDAATLSRFEKELQAVYRRPPPDRRAGLATIANAVPLIAELSKRAPELQVTELRLAVPAGEVTGTARLVLDGTKVDIGRNPTLILSALKADVELGLPRAMAKSLLAPLIRKDIESYRRSGALSQRDVQSITPEVLDQIVEEALPQYLPRHDLLRYLVPEGSRLTASAKLRGGQFLVNGERWRAPFVRLP